MKRTLLFPYSFVLMNWAAVVALYYFARGRKHIWHHTAQAIQKKMGSEQA